MSVFQSALQFCNNVRGSKYVPIYCDIFSMPRKTSRFMINTERKKVSIRPQSHTAMQKRFKQTILATGKGFAVKACVRLKWCFACYEYLYAWLCFVQEVETVATGTNYISVREDFSETKELTLRKCIFQIWNCSFDSILKIFSQKILILGS